MEIILTKILIFMVCFCSLNILRECYVFYQCYNKMEKYDISDKRMFGLWASVSFILTIIFTGF